MQNLSLMFRIWKSERPAGPALLVLHLEVPDLVVPVGVVADGLLNGSRRPHPSPARGVRRTCGWWCSAAGCSGRGRHRLRGRLGGLLGRAAATSAAVLVAAASAVVLLLLLAGRGLLHLRLLDRRGLRTARQSLRSPTRTGREGGTGLLRLLGRTRADLRLVRDPDHHERDRQRQEDPEERRQPARQKPTLNIGPLDLGRIHPRPPHRQRVRPLLLRTEPDDLLRLQRRLHERRTTRLDLHIPRPHLVRQMITMITAAIDAVTFVLPRLSTASRGRPGTGPSPSAAPTPPAPR
ncbi:hypothetical protein SVIOM342S_06886 [Streptomyces violaceorubidus]